MEMSVHKPVLHPDIFIVESGTKIGNLDKRFGSRKEIESNRRTFFAAANFEEQNAVYMEAVGGATFADINPQDGVKHSMVTDAFITAHNNIGLMLMPADCIPLVVYDPVTKVLALVHLGWRGCVGGLLPSVLNYIIQNYNVSTHDLYCYLGPSIGPDHYLMPDIHHKQKDAFWKPFVKQINNGQYSIDLPGFVQNELLQSGVMNERIVVSERNTASSTSLFSNYTSRHNKNTLAEGRNGFLVWRANELP